MTPFESRDTPMSGTTSGRTTSADISTLQTSLEITMRKMEEQVTRIREQEERVRAFEEKLDVRETRKVEILAILITLFTFLSININIFTRVNDIYTAIWFMLLMTICSLIIASALFLFIHNRSKWYQLLLVLLFLIAITVLLVMPNVNLIDIRLNPVVISSGS